MAVALCTAVLLIVNKMLYSNRQCVTSFMAGPTVFFFVLICRGIQVKLTHPSVLATDKHDCPFIGAHWRRCSCY